MELSVCEACRLRPVEMNVENEEPRQPYRVCRECARRLETMALRPLEWFNLAALHGPDKFLLHDDFYDENGVAYASDEDVEEPEKYPAPTLEEAARNPERLVDRVMADYWLTDEQVEALRAQDTRILLAVLQQRVASCRSLGIETRAYEICARVLGEVAGDWIQSRWESYRPVVLFSLADASAACLPPEEGFTRVTAALEPLPASELKNAALALAHFRSSDTLAWIENHLEGVHYNLWGQLAALSALSWPRVVRWLEAGRPLSLIALEALVVLRRYNTPLLHRYQPELLQDPGTEELERTLTGYLERDNVPNTRRLVATILESWPEPPTDLFVTGRAADE